MTTIDPADGLIAPTVGDWAEDKYLYVEHYARMFAKSMQGKWGLRAYLDIFAGAGRAVIKGSARVVDTASLRALTLEPTFDILAYGELDVTLIEALEKRCRARRPDVHLAFVQGDVNKEWPRLRDRIRESAGSGTSLTFCFVDPYCCGDLGFETLKGLSQLYIDFLVLIPSFMDAHRNEVVYTQESNSTLDRFLGDRAWRAAWGDRSDRKKSFGFFVADQYGLRMKALGFKYDGLKDMKLMRSTDQNLPLYHLAFFSRHDLGLKLWREALKSSDPQRRLF